MSAEKRKRDDDEEAGGEAPGEEEVEVEDEEEDVSAEDEDDDEVEILDSDEEGEDGEDDDDEEVWSEDLEEDDPDTPNYIAPTIKVGAVVYVVLHGQELKVRPFPTHLFQFNKCEKCPSRGRWEGEEGLTKSTRARGTPRDRFGRFHPISHLVVVVVVVGWGEDYKPFPLRCCSLKNIFVKNQEKTFSPPPLQK